MLIYEDPVYKTFVFHTKSGYSMCPHEAGTEPRERPDIQVVRKPTGKVFPDDPAIFELKLINNGKATPGHRL